MRCQQAETLIGAWQDGELDAWTSWRVYRHLRDCSACASEAESLRHLHRGLRLAAPLGAVESAPPARRTYSLVPHSLSLASAAIVTMLWVLRPAVVPLPTGEVGNGVPTKGVPSQRAFTPTPVTPVRTTVTPNPEPESRRESGVRHTPGRKRFAFQARTLRVSRKPSLLPPVTHPEWEGGSIRYVASLTKEERQVEIISIQAELPPIDELKKLLEEKSEFIFVQASLPPELREEPLIPNPGIP